MKNIYLCFIVLILLCSCNINNDNVDNANIDNGNLISNIKISSSDIQQISIGGAHILILTKDNDLYGYGGNDFGAFKTDPYPGDLPSDLLIGPVKIDFTGKIKQISAGSANFILDENGDVWTWGVTKYGALTFGSNEHSYLFKKIDFPEKIKTICDSAGGFFISESGNLYTYGWNLYGEFGNGTHNNMIYEPRKIDLPLKVIDVSYQHRGVLALLENGDVYTWASHFYFDKNVIKNSEHISSFDEVCPMFDYMLRPFKIPFEQKVISISAGRFAHYAVLEDGTLYSWGDTVQNINEYGLLGVPLEECVKTSVPIKVQISEPIKKVIAGDTTTFALSESGNTYAFGINNNLSYPEYTNLLLLDSPDDIIFVPQKITCFDDTIVDIIPDGNIVFFENGDIKCCNDYYSPIFDASITNAS